ncbi:hypothetical protein H4R18_005808 [Coemansia javaensis]|uniref:Derlin n=1 Tax=Coemansia javaensis TaxID=2761396 RepID=A0A9W8LF04_9FUNG|nr:hypothetical protein H4R18_005808 [Coemansia javaensis]
MNPLEEWYRQLPVFTRAYATAVVAVTLALQLQWVTPYQLFHSSRATFGGGEYWRLATTFLFLGEFSLNWVLNVYFIVRYCRDLEEGSYSTRPADFVWLVALACAALLALAPHLHAPFLGDLLVTALTYMWSRHYSHLFINFMGLITTSAAYLPWIMLAFSSVVEDRWPTADLAAMAVGHVLWFLSEEWPLRVESGGSRPLRAPRVLCRLLHQEIEGDQPDPDPGFDLNAATEADSGPEPDLEPEPDADDQTAPLVQRAPYAAAADE